MAAIFCRQNIHLKTASIIFRKFIISVPPKCCSTVSVSGAQWSPLNQLYFQADTLVSNRPLYVDSMRKKGIWFDGCGHWIVGTISHLHNGKLTTGFMTNDEVADCPTDSQNWKVLRRIKITAEKDYGGEWNFRAEISFKCDGWSIIKYLNNILSFILITQTNCTLKYVLNTLSIFVQKMSKYFFESKTKLVINTIIAHRY